MKEDKILFLFVYSQEFVIRYMCETGKKYQQFEKESSDRVSLPLPIRSSIFARWKGQPPPCASSFNTLPIKSECVSSSIRHTVALVFTCARPIYVYAASRLILSRVNASGANIWPGFLVDKLERRIRSTVRRRAHKRRVLCRYRSGQDRSRW